VSAVAIISGVIGGAITVVGYFFVARWQRKKEWQDKALGEHVEDLIKGPISSLLEYKLLYALDKDKLFASFNAHFPEMVKRWREYAKDVDAYYKEKALLIEEIKDFISKTVRVPVQFRNFSMKINTPDMPSIYENTPEVFWDGFLSHVARGLPPTLDFHEATTKIERVRCQLQCGAHTIAVTRTEEEAEEIKSSFAELQGTQEYIEKGRKIVNIYDRLEEKYEKLSEGLLSICEQYRKYKKLERQEGCPICQEIFNLKRKH
jgi:hypothetical protein